MIQLEMGISKSVSEPDDYRSCPPPLPVVDSRLYYPIRPSRASLGNIAAHAPPQAWMFARFPRPLIAAQVPDGNDSEIMMETPTDTSDQIVQRHRPIKHHPGFAEGCRGSLAINLSIISFSSILSTIWYKYLGSSGSA